MDFQIKFVRISLTKWTTNDEKYSMMFVCNITVKKFYEQNMWAQHAGMRPEKQTKQIRKSVRVEK
jgi:hypothetical protein